MLKALELVGFKSFADKTRFEFPRGITAVVGPNGSGKSNIVDAIKWVLGEQSVKSLRGKEMADVIFNGSGGRTALNAAETTLTFDNSQRLLPLDTPEVHITRRVYRNGEGEYLINRQPSRLRDIRDLFAGTGVGTEAYSVIEQGKVDVLLQSSPKERRAIFEEAAGISRFKAKKVESIRRLERVEQNLLRLSDIVTEVENRLRSVRQQASKARRYKEHADRLQELRTQVGLADWRSLSVKLETLETEVRTLIDEHGRAAAHADALEAEVLHLETALGDVTESVRRHESTAGHNREQIATSEATIRHERSRGRDLDEEVARHRNQLTAMGLRAGDLRQQLQETQSALAAAEAQHDDVGRQLTAARDELSALSLRAEALQHEIDSCRAASVERMRASGVLASEIGVLESQIAAARAAQDRNQSRLIELIHSAELLAGELRQLGRQQDDLQQAADDRQAELSAAHNRVVEYRQQHAARLADLNQLRNRQAGASERAAVLEELESRFEGLNAGVKELVLSIRKNPEGPFREVRGLVADLFRANVETAPLIDVALGERAQYLVVGRDRELLDFLAEDSYRFKGRVGFIRLESPELRESKRIELNDVAGVLGRADRFVETTAEMAPLAERLLGRTWIVEKLAQAVALAAGEGRGANFVTLAGELVSADGTISTGPKQGSWGLISRRSELRALKQLVAELDTSIAQTAQVVAQLDQQIAADEGRLETLGGHHQRAAHALAEHRMRVHAAEARLLQCKELRGTLESESASAASQLEQATAALATARSRRGEVEAQLAERDATIRELRLQLSGVAGQREQAEQAATTAKVALAKSEERLGNLQARRLQFERDQQERQRAMAEARDQLSGCRGRAQQCERNILSVESQLAELYLVKERLAGETTRRLAHMDQLRSERTRLVAEAQQVRSTARKVEERHHAKELAAHEVRHERTALFERLRDDYGIDLAAQELPPSEQELHEREAVDLEIAELRRKINNLGNVNLDALGELEELEGRFTTLSAQFADLSKAKALLEQIIGKINADSRRLFAETLETVKGHFQGLFRKLFGGGQADIVLDAGVDILDSGIEIIARPPGKEPRNISLLSGGEKTLTCVALLLAIFQYRPSPFCVLDEVDAALDEANIERFIAVLQEFLAWTQFIVVTHSKKTMTCATTLYGVTMQESGISKRVAVRFEDVSEDGEINASSPAPEAKNPDGEEGDETQAA